MDSSKTTKIISLVLVFFLLVTVISQIGIKLNDKVKTEVALMYSATDFIQFKGVYVRNEHQFKYDSDGIVSYNLEDGSKLAKNSVIAQVYNSDSDLLVKQQVADFEEKIKVLDDAQRLVGTDNSQLEAFNTQISEKHAAIVKAVDKGDYSEIKKLKNDYLNLKSKKEIVKGTSEGYSGKISEINSQITTLKSRISKPPADIIVGETGYFVSVADGYEDSINYQTAEKLSKEDIEKIIANPQKDVAQNVIGKIIDDYRWRFVGVLDAKKTLMIRDGKTVNLRVGSDSKTIEATVVSVKNLEDGNNIVIFECDQLTPEFLGSRVAQFKLLLDDYNGIRLTSTAVRFDKDNNPGVFIRSGVEVLFKRINIIYSEEDFVIAENTTEEAGYLSLFDSVVIDGKDLYDGKIIG